MTLNNKLRSVVDWLQAGYPAGVPPTDYIPLLALLRRGLTEDEVREVAEELAASIEDMSHTDIGVHITQITDALPSQADINRVARRLHVHGWPGTEPDHRA
ncbi:DUF3349 domain-containing protein [Demetria terragena]|uniref:DUF3349 domain-containing protein n=1 Tax=Demetria terragena TaxID=63959 RepID=UPI00037E0026|nr:DUF3349 domain-containing protein [Demetria terragena]